MSIALRGKGIGRKQRAGVRLTAVASERRRNRRFGRFVLGRNPNSERDIICMPIVEAGRVLAAEID